MAKKSQLVTIRMTEKEIETLTAVVLKNRENSFWTRTPGRTLRSVVDLIINSWDNDQEIQTTQFASGSHRK